MGIGVISLVTSQKREQSGPPFVATAADNGLSVDGVSGRIVLGNDFGDPAQPAVLLNQREIVTETGIGLLSIFLNSILTGIITELNGQAVNVTSVNGSSPSVSVSDTASGFPNIQCSVSGGLGGRASISASCAQNDTAQLQVASGANDQLSINTTGNGVINFDLTNLGITVMSMNTAAFQTQVGPGLFAFNGADWQISGSCTYRHMIVGKGAGNYNVDRNLDTNVQFINSGAATFTLPNMVGANNRAGFIFRVCVKNAGGVTVQASAGQVIRFGSLSTSSGGTLVSTDVGAYVKLIWDNSNWITETFLGAWALT